MARVSLAVLCLGAALATEETTASLRGSPAAATAAAAARRLGSCSADAKPCTALGQPGIWCFQDPSCPGGGYKGGRGCIADSGCRYCDATAMNGPGYDGEACPTDPAKCPRVQGGSGEYINTDLPCVYNPGCKNGAVSQDCFEQTGCQYTSGAALATEETTASLRGGSCSADAKPCTALGQPGIWCFQDPSCPGGGYKGGRGCIGDSGCRYCDATAMNGPGYDGEACPSPTPSPSNPCESLSETDPAKCPRVQGGSGEYINTDLPCVYNPGCKNGAVSQDCFEQTGCQYKS